MGISYESLQIFGSKIYDDKKRNYQLIDVNEFESRIQDVYGVTLGEGKYEQMLEEGVKEEDIHFEDYASMYTYRTFHEYSVLMIFDYGNFVSDARDVAVGFVIDLNKEGMEKIAEKQAILLEELEDFKVKMNFRISTPEFQSLTYVL